MFSHYLNIKSSVMNEFSAGNNATGGFDIFVKLMCESRLKKISEKISDTLSVKNPLPTKNFPDEIFSRRIFFTDEYFL